VLVNRLLGDERLIVADQPGTTRDSIDTELSYRDQRIVLIDTAGLRRAARVKDNVEFYTTLRSIRALQRADIVAVLVEAPKVSPDRTSRSSNKQSKSAKASSSSFNKWDLVEKDTNTIAQFTATFHEKAKLMSYIPLAFVSRYPASESRRSSIN